MKQFLTTLAALLTCVLLLAACSSTPSTVDESSDMSGEFENAPEWVLSEGSNIEGSLAAVGSSKIGKAGVGSARRNAIAQGRNELASQVEVKVKTMVKNFTQEIGVGDDQTVDRVSVQASKQVAKKVLNGAQPQAFWQSPSNTIYELVVLDPESLKQYIKDSVDTSFKREEALWQKYQAEKAWEELDKEAEKEFDEYKSDS
ncbi:MAG: LPP20 family lipoprotein [Bacteroidota bacterium]